MAEGASRDVRQDQGAGNHLRGGSVSAKEIRVIYPFRNACPSSENFFSHAFWLSFRQIIGG
jgi:hypothetical protein